MIFEHFSKNADMEWLMIEDTIIRAHQHAAGARRRKGARMPKVWGALGED